MFANRSGIPSSGVVCLFSTEVGEAVTDELRRYFELKEGYTIYHNTRVTVDDLMFVTCSIFCYSGHAIFRRDPKTKDKIFFGLTTSTPVTDETRSKYQKEIDQQLLGFYVNEEDLRTYYDIQSASEDENAGRLSFFINYDFIRTYWRFEPNSFVFINGCESFTNATGFESVKDVIVAQCGASVCGGWTGGSTGSDGDRAVLYLFDRLLGTNQWKDTGEICPPQRPFDWQAVHQKMCELHLDDVAALESSGTTRSKLRIEAGARGDLGLLLPSIVFLESEERERTLRLFGNFGTETSRMKVFVKQDQFGAIGPGDCQLAIDPSSDAWTIVCKNLPVDGPGTAGYVVITVEYGAGRPPLQSNAVPLTVWRGKMSFTVSNPGDGSIAPIATITAEVVLRGDIHRFRDQPDAFAVSNFVRSFMNVNDEKKPAYYTVKASFANSKYSWELTGSGTVPPFSNDSWGMWGLLEAGDHTHPKLSMGLMTRKDVRERMTDNRTGDVVFDDVTVLGTSLLPEMDWGDQLKGHVVWDGNYDIPGDSITRPLDWEGTEFVNGAPLECRLEWAPMIAEFPPTDQTAG